MEVVWFFLLAFYPLILSFRAARGGGGGGSEGEVVEVVLRVND